MDSNDLSLVIAQKSQKGLLSILKKDSQAINTSNQWGQTPLHLAVGWPFGVAVLIQNGANLDSADKWGATPFIYALNYYFAETVGLLVNAGCCLDSFWRGSWGNFRFCNETDDGIGRVTYMERRDATLTMFIKSLAERRRQLYRHAVAVAIPGWINACWVQNDRVLDEHTRCAEDALKYHGNSFSQTSTCLTRHRTVYHLDFLTAELAEELWQAGFHDVDVPDEGFETPLSKFRVDPFLISFDIVKNQLELYHWLIERGANIYRPMRCVDNHSEPLCDFKTQHLETRVLHIIAGNTACLVTDLFRIASRRVGLRKVGEKNCISLLSDFMESTGKNVAQLMATILSDRSSDGCLCACSSGGCTASTILQKYIATSNAWSWRPTECLMTLLGPQTPCEDWLIDEIIRFRTVQELQLKHTCCDYRDSFFNGKFRLRKLDPDEVTEFRNEDSEGIKLLEDLMTDFREKRAGQDVMTFLKGYWRTRMEEVHRTRGGVDLEKSKEMGVVWSKTDEDSDGEGENDDESGGEDEDEDKNRGDGDGNGENEENGDAASE